MFIGSESRPIILDLYREKTQIRLRIYNTDTGKLLGKHQLDFELKKVLLPPPLGNFADISYLEEIFKPHLLRDVCTLCSGALVSDSLLHMLL